MVEEKLQLEHDEAAISRIRKRKADHDDSGTPPTKLNPEAYTIGWICAISTEYVAAQAFLDKEHERPEYLSPNDNNDYTLGEIGEHNVVIAVLPNGEYGTATAASVAKDMLRSFPSIKIGLMVGIGGGAPSLKHDIRLGDIVVSEPRDGTGGVFQYDFGKTIQDQSFQHTRFLNQPPMSLGTAVNGIKAHYEINGHRLEEKIDSILEKKPRLRRKYKRPETSSDRLYQSRVVHPANEASCAEVCGDDPSNLILRPKRMEHDDNPAIHYGLIASANQLMKDALVRDMLVADKGVLCFEMEAAGLMNQYPFLVIRGICDYSDSHKNKDWQGYAAMAAAAYAKDLLHRIPPNKVKAERKIIEIITSVTVQRLDIEHRQAKIKQWLAPPDPSMNHKNAMQQCYEGSGRWFIRNEQFINWKTQRNSFLWLYGIPGCGKTILSSTIIEYLASTPSSPLLSFYFVFNDTSKQTLEIQVHEAWIVLDALDECCTRNGSSTEGILSWIRDLVHLDQKNVHLLVTSRPEQDIQTEFDEWTGSENRLRIQSNLIADDISAYIRARIKEDKGLMRWHLRRDVQEEIETTLTERADGMFRWVACQLDALVECYDYDDLQHALAHLPRTLDETYSRILDSVSTHEKHKVKAIKILQLLAFSERPLRIDEVVDAIIVDAKRRPHFDEKRRMPNPQDVARYCKSLVVVSRNDTESTSPEKNYKDNLVLQLAHFSVKEYLNSDRVHPMFSEAFQEATARASIATTCTAYLLHLDRDVWGREIQKKFPFAEYCARYWLEHAAARSPRKDEAHALIMELFGHKAALINWRQLYESYSERQTEPVYPLYYASLGGLEYEVEALIAMGEDVNAQGGLYGNALNAASAGGNARIVKLLLEGGANINAPGAGYGSVLQAASYRGHEHIVKLLLDRGADVNAQGGEYGNALTAASFRGYEQIVKLLLDSGANINAPGGGYGNVLVAASMGGHQQIIKLLLGSGAEVNAHNKECNALLAASARGDEQIVKLLLDSGADINIRGKYWKYTPSVSNTGFCEGNALQAASAGGYAHIVKLLLESDADVNAPGGPHGSALIEASGGGYEQIVKLLLKNGANINTQYGDNGNALMAASAGGYEKIVTLLLKSGANANAKGGYQGNALQRASGGGHEQIVRLLLENGANIDVRDGLWGNALQRASDRGYEHIVKLLLESGADVNAPGGDDGNALQGASGGGHKQIVRLLLESGANIDVRDGLWGNALTAASAKGDEQIVKLLLESGADVNAPGGKYGNALQVASRRGHEQIVKLLLKCGANVNAQGGNYGNALIAASAKGDERIVKLLLESGADVNAPSGEYGNALQEASGGGHEQIVKLLLKCGADVNAPVGEYGSALIQASDGGYDQIVRLLLQSGANINAQSIKYGNALTAASAGGYKQIVELLLKSGADVNTQGEKYGNALTAASASGNEQIVKLLLNSGVDINAGGKYWSEAVYDSANGYGRYGRDGNALQAASNIGHIQIVKMLVESGADVNAPGGSYGNALIGASDGGHEQIVKLLLESGADVNAQDEHYGNALTTASRKGHEHIVKLLLENGQSSGRELRRRKRKKTTEGR
ncbi:hypothetical protein EIK77_006985 [Talaromyces pinophilus]|nr:hypothetical protein EIK77_006985 [Talaromyces pinophilus]